MINPVGIIPSTSQLPQSHGTSAKENMTLFQRKLKTLDGISSLHTDMKIETKRFRPAGSTLVGTSGTWGHGEQCRQWEFLRMVFAWYTFFVFFLGYNGYTVDMLLKMISSHGMVFAWDLYPWRMPHEVIKPRCHGWRMHQGRVPTTCQAVYARSGTIWWRGAGVAS